jgi:hypothetical protein
MIFLIRYDRKAGTVSSMQEFPNEKQQEAAEARLALEIELFSCGADVEVVVLEAESEAALRKTHRRYFENLRTLANPRSNTR